MGDISIIARRLSDQHVQHGWSGNGGHFDTVGRRLLTWYDSPDMVEYLFGLGQLQHLWKPHSEEHTSAFFRTVQDGLPHWVDPSERWIFSKIAFIDFGYFYDADQTWYYVIPGPFRIKIPLILVAQYLDDKFNSFDVSFESSFRKQVERLVLERIFSGQYADLLGGTGHDSAVLQKIREDLACEDFPLHKLWDHHRSVFECFDDWILIRPDESGKEIGEILLRPKEEDHLETIFW